MCFSTSKKKKDKEDKEQLEQKLSVITNNYQNLQLQQMQLVENNKNLEQRLNESKNNNNKLELDLNQQASQFTKLEIENQNLKEKILNMYQYTSLNEQKEQNNLNEYQKIAQEINILNKIKLGKDVIGQGKNGKVYKYNLGNTALAVKCYQNKQEAEEENEILEKIQNIKEFPNIIPYYGMKKLKIEILDQQPFEGFALFFKACKSDLKQFLDSNRKLTPDEVLDFLYQMSVTLTYLHTNDCFHRDLKPANILFNETNDKKEFFLCDFGESSIIEAEMQVTYETQSLRGTPFYWPPELYTLWNQKLLNGKFNPIKVDMYCLGIIALQLLLGSNYLNQLSFSRFNKIYYFYIVKKF